MTFTVPGQPRGKGRPRFARRGNFVTTYTDDKTASYENLIALAYKAAGGTYHETGSVTIGVAAHYAIPKSASKVKREKMLRREIKPQTKPDIDNILKAVMDGLNKVAYADDKQITCASVSKSYDDEPMLIVVLIFTEE